jgi:TRAP transporter TAXI family solute receptor
MKILLLLNPETQIIKLLMAILWLCCFLGTGSTATMVHAQNLSVAIGTGGVTGVYYPTGKGIARIVNRRSKENGIQVKVESTNGSVFNVNAIIAQDLEFGIVQSDRQYQAWNGIKDWKDRGPQKKLRSICSFHSESLILVAGNDTGIETLSDLKRKRVNIGNLGSGPRGNAIDTMQSCGLNWRGELSTVSIRAADSARLLQEGRIDAFFYMVGHPNESIIESTSGKRKVHFVPIIGNCVDQLVNKLPYYTKAEIPIRFYPSVRNKENVKTFGVKATFLTSADVPDKVVYLITREIFNNLEEFKKIHPAIEDLTKHNMLEALSAPIHSGALKFYSEAGFSIPSSLISR